MKVLSKTEYEKNDGFYSSAKGIIGLGNVNYYNVGRRLSEIDLPAIYFLKIPLAALESVQHLIPEKDKEACLAAIKTIEKYLRGEVTKEECNKVASAVRALGSVGSIKTYLFAYANFASNPSDLGPMNFAHPAACAQSCASIIVMNKFPDVDADTDFIINTKANIACDIIRQAITWNLVCAFQIAKCFGREEDEQFIQEITKDEKLISYTTILLEDENLRNEFEFLIKDYVNK